MQVLIIEDNEGDQRIIQEAFKKSNPAPELIFVKNTDAAMHYLKQGNVKPEPQIILLDLNLPCKNGKDFLKELKTDQQFKHIPVLILTSSQAEKDIRESYALGASCYLKKPMQFQEFFDMIDAISKFWLKEVIFSPPNSNHVS